MALDFGKLNFSTSFNPTSAFPLDARYYFESKTAADAAAATAEAVGSSNTVYYFGEQIVVVEDSKATIYVIQPKSEGAGGELVEVGSKTLGDDKTIALENGTLSLKDFGKSYYKYVAKTESAEAHYEKVDGFKAGLQPQITTENGQLVLAWYEPNPTTVEGLEAEISALSSSVQDITNVLGDEEAGLIKDVADNADAIKALDKDVNGYEDEEGKHVDGIKDDITAINGTIQQHEADIDKLEDAINGYDEKGEHVAGLKERVTALEEEAQEDEWAVPSLTFAADQAVYAEGDLSICIGFKNITEEQDKILSDLRYSAINIDATAAGLPKGTIYRNGDAEDGYDFLLDIISGPASDIMDVRMHASYDKAAKTVDLKMFQLATENFVGERIQDHIDDPNILHVNSAEKAAWNAKQEQIESGDDFVKIAEDNKTISLDFTNLILDGGSASDWTEAEEVSPETPEVTD